MGAGRVVFIIILIIHIIATIGHVGFSLIELPPTLAVSSPVFMVFFAMSMFALFADAICIVAIQGATKTVGRPDRTASQVTAYVFLAITAIAHFFIVFTMATNYGRANTQNTLAGNPANDIEYCCVFTGHAGCPLVPCVAGHKSQIWELRVDWRFLLFFWTVFGLLVLEILMMLLLQYAPSKHKLSTIGAVPAPSTENATPVSTSSSSSSTPLSPSVPPSNPAAKKQL